MLLLGNKKSLYEAMGKNGVNMREEVLKMFNENYHGGMMKLVVIGGGMFLKYHCYNICFNQGCNSIFWVTIFVPHRANWNIRGLGEEVVYHGQSRPASEDSCWGKAYTILETWETIQVRSRQRCTWCGLVMDTAMFTPWVPKEATLLFGASPWPRYS